MIIIKEVGSKARATYGGVLKRRWVIDIRKIFDFC